MTPGQLGPMRTVGRSLPKVDAPDKVRGMSRYADDLRFPGLLVARLVRSYEPHARVVSVDDEAALAEPGVVAVISSLNLSQRLGALASFDPASHDFERQPPYDPVPGDLRIFDSTVRYQGEPVAAVVAENFNAATRGAALVDVTYESLDSVLSPGDAMASGAALLHEGAPGNIASNLKHSSGDADAALREAAFVVRRRFSTSKQKQAQMEPTCCVVEPSADGGFTVWSPSQSPHRARHTLANIFGLPLTKVRVINTTVGGAFGKGDALNGEPYAAALALITGRPVKLRYSRTEDFVGTESRHPVVADVQAGFAEDGSITGLRARVVVDAGAYLSHSPRIATVLAKQLHAVYDLENFDVEILVAFTNTPVSGAFRGYGGPQAAFPLEHVIDLGARAVGVDPLSARLAMLKRVDAAKPGSRRGLLDCIETGRRALDWESPREALSGTARGVGMAAVTWKSGVADKPGALDRSSASVQVNADGSVEVISAGADLGTGLSTTLAQIAAETLNVPFEHVQVSSPDTAVTPFDSGAFSSRSLYRAGEAVRLAAVDARRRLLEYAAELLETTADDLELSAGRVTVHGAPGKGIDFRALLNRGLFEGRDFRGQGNAPPTSAPSAAAQFAEVEIDLASGQTRVLRLVAVQDVGRAINPVIVEGQIQGAAYQGLGYAVSEDLVVDRDTGATLTGSFMDYRLPTVMDGPQVEALMVEHPDETGPYGAKGVGEPSIILTAPAIANAILNATGVSVTDLPMTPERVYRALQNGGEPGTGSATG